MKKTIVSLSLLFLFNSAFSQLDKGVWLIGGTGSFSHTMFSENQTETNISISPNIGYFVIDKFVAGIRSGYTYSKLDGGSIISKVNAFKVGPFVRYYFLPKDYMINLFSDVSYAYEHAEYSNGLNDNIHYYGFALGTELFFNTAVGLELAVGYNHIKLESGPDPYKKIFGSIGFQFHLEREKNE